MGQRGQGDVTSRLTTGRSILTVEFRGEAVQRAGPHVLRGSGGVWSAGGWRAALGGGTLKKIESRKDQLRYIESMRKRHTFDLKVTRILGSRASTISGC